MNRTEQKKRAPVVLVAIAPDQVRAIGTTVLEAAGFEVRTENRGESLLAGLGTRRPDLILTDLQLEDMDAARLCSEIRKTAAGQTVPILVISDSLHSPTIQSILAKDFTDFTFVTASVDQTGVSPSFNSMEISSPTS